MGDLGSIPGLGRPLGEGKGYPLQYSGLENSTDSIVRGVTKSRTRLSDFHFHLLSTKLYQRLRKYAFSWSADISWAPTVCRAWLSWGGHPNLECGTWGLKLSYRKAGRPPSRPWMTWAEVQGDRPGSLGGERAVGSHIPRPIVLSARSFFSRRGFSFFLNFYLLFLFGSHLH